MTADNIHYIYQPNMGMELIFCENSAISYPPHNHVSVFTVGLVLNGSIALTTNKHEKIYGKNQAFVICPYMPHSISARSSYTLLSLCIDKKIATHRSADQIWHTIMTLLTEASHEKIIRRQHILQFMDSVNALDVYTDGHLDSQNPLISDLKKQLELYPENRLSIDEMAQSAFVSKYHFIRSFKAEVGLTPHQFQLQNRIRKAQRLMRSTATITEVAFATDFCDQSHFTKQFEKQVGLSPLAYKSAFRIMNL